MFASVYWNFYEIIFDIFHVIISSAISILTNDTLFFEYCSIVFWLVFSQILNHTSRVLFLFKFNQTSKPVRNGLYFQKKLQRNPRILYRFFIAVLWNFFNLSPPIIHILNYIDLLNWPNTFNCERKFWIVDDYLLLYKNLFLSVYQYRVWKIYSHRIVQTGKIFLFRENRSSNKFYS